MLTKDKNGKPSQFSYALTLAPIRPSVSSMRLRFNWLSFLLLLLVTTNGCEDTNNQLSESLSDGLALLDASALLDECLLRVKAEQDALAKSEGGRSELVGINTDESYLARLPSRSYQSIDQRLNYFELYGDLNLTFAFWGSYRNQNDLVLRYVIVRSCSLRQNRIVSTRRSKKIKLTQ